MKTNQGRQALFKRIVPPLAGLFFLLLFVKLGFWQLDRAKQKIELQKAFDAPARHIQVTGDIEPEPFQAIKSRGRYLNDKQIFIDNIVVDGALGYYVITPFEYRVSASLLLVNRGWIRKKQGEAALPDITIDQSTRLIHGRAGWLPRVGIRPGEAFLDQREWPRTAVWPTAPEVAMEIGQQVLPFVLLLDPDEESNFVRRWQPKRAGPSTNYGYAFQWFAMAIAVLVIMWKNLGTQRTKHDR